jgi:signal transduction histidine kinase
VHLLTELASDLSYGITAIRARAARIAAETELFETHQRLEALMQALPVGISFSDDPTCQRITGNPAVLAQFEIGPEDNLSASAPDPNAAGRKVRFFKEGRQISDKELPLQQAVAQKQVISPMELEVVLPSGKRWFAEASGSPIYDQQGNVIGGVAMTVDITERRRYEQQLKQLTEELRRSNADLQQFAYVASHDLREPLRAITGFMDLLHRRFKDVLDEKANEYIDYAASGAKRMDELLTGLLQYSRVQTQDKPRATVPAQAALNAALENLRADIDESNAAISSDPLPSVNVDGMQFMQLLQNLLHNAIKFRSDQRPQIHVGCAKHEDGWMFSVRDNGIGIKPQYYERIFAIFQRLHPRDKYAGTGVGLSICKRIVDNLGGRIWVESQPGKGSTFYFTVPQTHATK